MDTQPTEEAVAEIWKLFRETDSRLARVIEETDKRFRQTDAGLRRLEGMFGIQWGRMMEALVQPAALQFFQEWGIDVHESYRRLESRVNGHHMELDIVSENANDTVIIEVKSLVKVRDVDDLLEDLGTASTYFTRFIGRRVFGGIAGLEFAEGTDAYAFRQGLFVLALSGERRVKIKKRANFRLKDYGNQ